RYVETLWALSLCLTLAHARRPRRGLVVALGLVTAAMIGFKHTSGIYDAWAVGLCLVLVARSDTARDGTMQGAAQALALVPGLFVLAALAALPILAGGLGGVGNALLVVWSLPMAAAFLVVLPALVPGWRRAWPLPALARGGRDLVWFGAAALALTGV